ncbi:aminotransferase class I/II-fold pyridoxal phosphate-dependent enzyme [Anaerocolumna sedimenticola]|uniref:Aminotransferase class I/II-fold pyridoxal phosphate-dependent enzyme n=1 Tax=Anaerocolumna sedimenticola TaxID=2696063 RepID=A0A6P1TQ58_9FIRM|nr:PLP-dependent aminotransferase family protein [Anaerocolumna sedimenticola]QHQ62477.1 aminotransferase class I/II-fold pyridoxal phosphate-dependent enzyme [Anaerocolumna sedimenticola]
MDILLDKTLKQPIYIQIYEQIRLKIMSGEMEEGTVLPPERKLAVKLGVNRSTILNAYNRLKAEELIESRVGQGTVVSVNAEERNEIVKPKWNQLFNNRLDDFNNNMISRLFPLLGKKDIISFALGMANPDLIPELPFAELADITKDKANREILSQTPVAGNEELRENICKLLAKESITCTPEEIMVLTGSQQGIDIATRIIIQPGDVVIVEAPTYFLALESFKSAGAKIIEVPIDNNGMQMEGLEQLFIKYHPKCIYTIPNCQNPSSCSMSLVRRKKLLELAYRYDVFILEDDAYAGLGFTGKTLPTLYQLDTNGYVLLLRTFSKTICSGIRLGYMAAHKRMIAQCCFVRQNMDIHPNTISQWLICEYIKSGTYEVHLKKIKEEYLKKCNLMHNELLNHAPVGLSWSKPSGGYYFWCHLPKEIRTSELLVLCIRDGVAFMPGIPFFTYENGENYMRLNFTTPTARQIQKGIPILCSNMKKLINTDTMENRLSPSNFLPLY